MGRVIRLTENDLLKIVRRVINEDVQSNVSQADKNSLISFLSGITCGGNSYYPQWRIDKSADKYKDCYTITEDLITKEKYPQTKNAMDTGCWNHTDKLYWSLYKNNTKIKGPFFYIDKLANGLFFNWNDGGYKYPANDSGYSPLASNEKTALEKWNKIQNAKYPA